MTNPSLVEINSGEKTIFASLQFNGHANPVREMGGFIYHTSIIVVLLDRRDIKIWHSAWGRTNLANTAKENIASLATLAKHSCPLDNHQLVLPGIS